MLRTSRIVFVCVACTALLTGCVAYEPVPAYYPSAPPPAPRAAPTFDRAWHAVLDALHENGVRVATADFATGVIRGTKDRTDLFVSVARQANGTVQVEIRAKGPQGPDTGLASRISEAYQRRMGV
ncbi:MAG: hypothetical protein JJE42_14750 [Burkholderiales bacterium]|nr:hypothetical protein [Burkholderiales bacterium]